MNTNNKNNNLGKKVLQEATLAKLKSLKRQHDQLQTHYTTVWSHSILYKSNWSRLDLEWGRERVWQEKKMEGPPWWPSEWTPQPAARYDRDRKSARHRRLLRRGRHPEMDRQVHQRGKRWPHHTNDIFARIWIVTGGLRRQTQTKLFCQILDQWLQNKEAPGIEDISFDDFEKVPKSETSKADKVYLQPLREFSQKSLRIFTKFSRSSSWPRTHRPSTRPLWTSC